MDGSPEHIVDCDHISVFIDPSDKQVALEDPDDGSRRTVSIFYVL